MFEASVLLRLARARLQAIGAATPALDARLLLQAAAHLRADTLIADPDIVVSQEAAHLFETYVVRRECFEPVSRILGRREFCGFDFDISPAVLDPRPETEHLVEEVVLLGAGCQRLLDLGTGSGAIAIAVAMALPMTAIVAVDVSPEALAVAKSNATKLGVDHRIAFQQSDWFSNVTGCFDIIVSNPPYIPSAEIAALSLDVKAHDPHISLDGGADGLDCYRAIAQSAARYLMPRGYIFVEIGHDQLSGVAGLFEANGFKMIKAYRDYAGLDRGAVFRLAES
jgi:release factor glutamine methyltransferase